MVTEQFSSVIEYKEIKIPEFMERYHFEKKDMEMIISCVRFVCEATRVEMIIGYEEKSAVCAVTLGKKYDKLSDVVAENLLLAYCVECVGMELLSKAYERVNVHVHEKMGMWLGGYRFPEEDGIQDGLLKLQPEYIEWKNGMLRPAKSVVFTAQYVDDKKQSGCEHCSLCGNVFCVFRKQEDMGNNLKKISNTSAVGENVYSYGIHQIFGNNRK